VAKLRKGEDVPYSSLSHPSPLGWEHVDLTDDFIWTGEQKVSENVDGTLRCGLPPKLSSVPPDIQAMLIRRQTVEHPFAP
jgi:hypothetical protein